MKITHILTATALLVLASGCDKSSERAKTGEPQAEQVAASHEAPHWSYEGETGPGNWGTLDAEWSPCGDGERQSPIDIDQTVQADLPEMSAAFQPASLKIIHNEHVADGINNGHTVQINYSEGDVLTIGAEQFQLVQYHFHSPSEHTVRGRHYPMEMHLVHKSAADKLAVVGVFIEEGAHNTAFDPIWSNLPATRGDETHLENVMVDVNQLLPASTKSYRYDGSLTTPPCSEGVKWIVMATPIQLSTDQIGAFRNIINGNNRPVQPLNGRSVLTDHVAESGM
ncbi:MAG TPA: carbonic anhydrase family protein [Candidatus Krumholzibacteria bacterium]|nr:carbonic anhydrase family protein [Candidatus Krumholzibacteria bacterium]